MLNIFPMRIPSFYSVLTGFYSALIADIFFKSWTFYSILSGFLYSVLKYQGDYEIIVQIINLVLRELLIRCLFRF